MKIDDMIKELRNLKEEATTFDDYTVSDPQDTRDRYDAIIDALKFKNFNAVSTWFGISH